MIRYFAAHPTAANLLMGVLLVIGGVALPQLQRETFPDFTPREIEVRIAYPGAGADDVEQALCQRLEDAVDTVREVDEVRCEAREGLARLVVAMGDGGELGRFLDEIRTEVEAVDDFPEQAETPVIRELGRTDRVVAVALTGPMDPPALKRYAEQLKERLQRLAAVSQVEIQGFSEHQLRVEVPAVALHRHGLGLSDIAAAITRQNLQLPAGSIETRERELLLRFSDERQTPAELAELVVIGAPGGGEIRLGDIARISDRFEQDEERLLFDGQRAALLQVTKSRSEDTLRVVEAVRAFVEQERQRAPPTVTLALTQDVASIVSDRLRMLVTNGWQGLLLVFLAMWLFFRLRFALWVAMGLPVAFLGGLFFMALLGYSLNMLTMVGLLIAIGLLMDDAIVIAENIAVHVNRGKAALAAAVDGTREVLPGVLASFLTTAAVFGPLAFLEGDIGKVLRVIPVVLILVLAVSLIEAFFILPHHLAHALARPLPREGRLRTRFEEGFVALRERGLGRAVDAALRQRYLFIGAVLGLFLVSLALVAGGRLKFQAFPEVEGDVIEARLLLPQGTPLWRTEAAVERLTAALRRVDAEFPPQPGGATLVRQISVRFNSNPDAHESGAHLATVSADLLTAERRSVGIDRILRRWREETGTIADVLRL
ncbi:MAG: efflux RND transporter permease subunit, partial [Candidatus Competibacterales bacterium]|nr:efflux RND transporter permease subunit [Candidatus Competibacterales bacterium]